MTKVREIIQDAMLEIGALAVGDAMPADGALHALRVLNRMVQKWNTEELMVYTINRNLFSLVAGQQSYTLGTGGNFNIARPVQIQMASVWLNTGVEVPIKIVTDEEWRRISVKATPSTFPTQLWIKGDMPLNTLLFWPVPQDASVQVALYCWGKTENFAGLDDDVIFPNGYEEALVTNLAVALSSSYQMQPSPFLINRASLGKSSIESVNIEPLWAYTSERGSSLAIQSFGYQVD